MHIPHFFMAVKLKSLLSDSVIYGLSGVLTRFIVVFLTPFYTRVYSPGDYGIMGMLNNGYSLVTILLVFALDNSTARWFYDTEDISERKKIINTWLWFYLTMSIITCAVIYFVAPFLSHWLVGDPESGVIYFRLLAFSLPMMVWMAVANNVLRFERKVIPTVLLTLVFSLTLIGFNVLFVLYYKMGLKGAYYAQLITAFFSMLLSVYLMKNWIGSIRFFDFKRLFGMIKYSFPFVPASLAYWLVNLSGVFFVSSYLSVSEAGLYQIGTSIAAFAGLVTIAFQQAWAPFAFSIINQPDAKTIYAKVFYIYVVIVGLLCMVVSLFSTEALMILTTPKYYGASWVASILVFSYLAMGLTNIADVGLAIVKKTAPLGFISIIAAIMLVCLNCVLIPLMGKEGAALAICLSQLAVPVYLFYKSQKYYYIPYQFAKALIVLFVILVFTLAGRMIVLENMFVNILWKAALLIIVIFSIWRSNKSEFDKLFVVLKNKVAGFNVK